MDFIRYITVETLVTLCRHTSVSQMMLWSCQHVKCHHTRNRTCQEEVRYSEDTNLDHKQTHQRRDKIYTKLQVVEVVETHFQTTEVNYRGFGDEVGGIDSWFPRTQDHQRISRTRLRRSHESSGPNFESQEEKETWKKTNHRMWSDSRKCQISYEMMYHVTELSTQSVSNKKQQTVSGNMDSPR